VSGVPAVAPGDPAEVPDPASAGGSWPDGAASGDGPREDPAGEEEGGEEEGGEEHPRAPWHFKVLLAGTVVYLGYRLYQGISWLAHHL